MSRFPDYGSEAFGQRHILAGPSGRDGVQQLEDAVGHVDCVLAAVAHEPLDRLVDVVQPTLDGPPGSARYESLVFHTGQGTPLLSG